MRQNIRLQKQGLRLVAFCCLFLATLAASSPYTHAAGGSMATHDRKRQTICKRVLQRFGESSSKLARINQRLEGKLGFACLTEDLKIGESKADVQKKRSKAAIEAEMEQYQMRAAKGDMNALYALGSLYLEEGSQDSLAKAYAFFAMAALSEHDNAKKMRDEVKTMMTQKEFVQANEYFQNLLQVTQTPKANIKKISPEEQRDAQRRSDVNVILNVIWMYAMDNTGKLPFDVPQGTKVEICKDNASSCSGMASLKKLFETYGLILSRSSTPIDPAIKTGNGTGYHVEHQLNNTIKVSAPHAEGAEIYVSR